MRAAEPESIAMAAPYPSNDPYLQKGFEPIRMECDYADLVVDGTIPTDLARHALSDRA